MNQPDIKEQTSPETESHEHSSLNDRLSEAAAREAQYFEAYREQLR